MNTQNEIQTSKISTKIVQGILVILGILFILIGIDKAFGGILTLGIQGKSEFLKIVDPYGFSVQDNHVRFFGGVFAALGMFLMLSSRNILKYKEGLNLLFVVVFVGGLARFTMNRPDIIFGKDIILSLTVEIILMPILFFWLRKNTSDET